MIKKMVVKGCVLGVVIAGFFFYANYLYTGSLPTVPGASMDEASSKVAGMGNSLRSRLNAMWDAMAGGDKTSGDPGAAGEIYRWKDETGAVHFGDHPPENALDLTLVDKIDPDTNLIQSPVSKPVGAPSQLSPGQRPQEQDVGSIGSMGNVLDKAKNARDLMNERNRRQQQILDKT